MLYAILAYHVEAEVMSWTPEQDAAVMTDLLRVHDRLNAKKLLGPSARLGATGKARTLRGPGAGMVIDGPFAETKEQLLGLYVVNCADEDAALAVARDLRKVNPSAVYEIRPIGLYIPGEPFPITEAPDGSA
ncbi:MAG: YciI family protein [Bradyrhizobium sp.]